MTARPTRALGAVVAAAAGAALALAEFGAVAALQAAALGALLAVPQRRGRAAAGAALVLVAATVGQTAAVASALLVAVHLFDRGRHERLWAGVAWLAAFEVALQAGVLVLDSDSTVPFVFIPLAGWAGGRALREREQVAARLAERVRELDEEREAHAALSVRYERARIASELHDIVAHAISVMVVQAGAGQRLAAHDPDATARTFRAISDAARQAEADMGRLVALLGDEHAIGEAPDLALVEELVRRAGASGLDVSLRLEGEREGLPAASVSAAYRVVQEGMTNALRYAAGATVRVLVRGDREGLAVEVVNGPAGDAPALSGTGTGNGLRGLRERVGACGGSVEAGPTYDGGWRLAARLPRDVLVARA